MTSRLSAVERKVAAVLGVPVSEAVNGAAVAEALEQDALDDTDWGDAGPHVGNSVLVARVFHVGLVALRRCGIEAIVNRPFDARVRARYTAMGFHGGERLDLTNNAALGRTFAFVGRVYADHDLDLDAPPP